VADGADGQQERGGGPSPEPPTGVDVGPYLEAYVERLKTEGALADPSLERAFRRVPRHLFVERFFVPQEAEAGVPPKGFEVVEHDPDHPQPAALEKIYADASLQIRVQDGLGTSACSQPVLVAQMLRVLELRPGLRVLEVGAGTGYNAALLAELVGDPARVTTVDIQEDVAAQARRALARVGYGGPGGVRVLARDGFAGAPEAAPFDRIVATVGLPDLSPRWVEQLAPGGFMLLPLLHVGTNPLVRLWREASGGGAGAGAAALCGRVVGFSGFMAAQGALGDSRYYNFAPVPSEGPQEERPLWPEFRTGEGPAGQEGAVAPVPGPRGAQARRAFLYYLGVADPRVRTFRWLGSFGLEDKAAGRAARVDVDRLVGDPGLLDALEAAHRAWRRLGAPDMSRYALRFVPVGGAEEVGAARAPYPEAGPWTLPGRYYRRVITLSPARPALPPG
jgi:protein-L-isoaspartate(D-aspartate) O-methyltransferase